MKHTPAPWISDEQQAPDDDGIATIAIFGPDGPGMGRTASAYAEIGRRSELKPNARLIAAAPELLGACKAIVACIIDCETCDATGIEIGTKTDACWSCGGVGQVLSGDDIFAAFDARDAIAKADGK